jgi:hypothetical protein
MGESDVNLQSFLSWQHLVAVGTFGRKFASVDLVGVTFQVGDLHFAIKTNARPINL